MFINQIYRLMEEHNMYDDNAKLTRYYCDLILGLIPKKKCDAVKAKDLMNLTGMTFRHLKQIITILREKHPICSRETNGGGYWMAENEVDINRFINMIESRKRGYETTIEVMTKHLVAYHDIYLREV